MKQTVLST